MLNITSKSVTGILTKENFKKAVFYLFMAATLAFALNYLTVDNTFAQSTAGYDTQQDDKPEWITKMGGGDSARDQARQFINFFLGFLGFIATAMIIYGGFLYVTAAGNQEKTDQGKKIITYSIIGILIILISFAIVNTVLSGATSGNDQTDDGSAAL